MNVRNWCSLIPTDHHINEPASTQLSRPSCICNALLFFTAEYSTVCQTGVDRHVANVSVHQDKRQQQQENNNSWRTSITFMVALISVVAEMRRSDLCQTDGPRHSTDKQWKCWMSKCSHSASAAQQHVAAAFWLTHSALHHHCHPPLHSATAPPACHHFHCLGTPCQSHPAPALLFFFVHLDQCPSAHTHACCRMLYCVCRCHWCQCDTSVATAMPLGCNELYIGKS